MSEDTSCNVNCGGCIFTIFVLWALLFGLPTPWGILHFNLLPPEILLK